MNRNALSICTLAFSLLHVAAGAQITANPVLSATPRPAGQAAGSPAAPPAKGATGALSPEYRIGAYDTLQVTVWKEPTISGSLPVRPDGKISLVLLGDVMAAGKTPMQLGEEITGMLRKFIQDPLVTVTVTAVNSQKVYVLGEVQRVGPVDLVPGMTPLEAIASAGGLNTYANGKHAYILRGEAGKQTKIPFDYKKALKGTGKENIQLQTGDTVVIP